MNVLSLCSAWRTLTEEMSDPILEARARAHEQQPGHAVLVLRLYCERPGCSAREIEVLVKETGPRIPVTERLVCPICGRRAVSVHAAQTLGEHERDAEAEARRRVNAQRWVRDHPDAFAIPVSVFGDESLPP